MRATYSIEAEDLIAERIFYHALGHAETFKGTYVDIGAFDPVKHSNTHLFHQRGWSGLTVDPNPAAAERFKEQRPEGTHVVAAIGNPGEGEYIEFDDPLINGFLPANVINHHLSMAKKVIRRTVVPFVPINDLLAKHVRSVDLLNIDVEMMEHEILSAWDFDRWTPRLIISEVHTWKLSLASVLNHPVTKLLEDRGYDLFSRLWHSSIFVKR